MSAPISLRELASKKEYWKASPMGRWESRLGQDRLRALIQDEWKDARVSDGALLKNGELLKTVRMDKTFMIEQSSLILEAGESRLLQETVSGSGALVRHVQVTLKEGSSLRIEKAVRGGALKEIWTVNLAKNSVFELKVAAHLKADDMCEICTHVVHEEEGSSSHDHCFFALEGKAFGGHIASADIQSGVHGTHATQLAKALHLEKGVSSYLRPWMAIGNDITKANHGAASGPMEAEQAFYLASRGIHLEKAKDMIAQAFLAQAFSVGEHPATPPRSADEVSALEKAPSGEHPFVLFLNQGE